jgi:hyperosmotically inducible protein
MSTTKTFSYSKPQLGALLSVTLIAGAISFAHAAHAETEKMHNSTFDQVDENHDGYVSLAEAKKRPLSERAFMDADANHDNKLDADEFIKAVAIDERVKVGRYVDDSVITTKIKAELLKDSLIKGLKVSVETYKGTVQLSGFVDNERQAAKAAQVAASVKGVKSVINNLIVKS